MSDNEQKSMEDGSDEDKNVTVSYDDALTEVGKCREMITMHKKLSE